MHCGKTDYTGAGGPIELGEREKEQVLGWPPRGSEGKSGALAL